MLIAKYSAVADAAIGSAPLQHVAIGCAREGRRLTRGRPQKTESETNACPHCAVSTISGLKSSPGAEVERLLF